MPSFVQFMHPGSEAIPDRETHITWNKNDHKRKFVRCRGTRLDRNSNEVNGEIMFWCEWEPESLIVRKIQKPIENGPRYVYEPYYVKPNSYDGLLTTDPFVFGKEFRYSWCRQPRLRSLRELDKGSVILFGSCIEQKFVLDTVFVVSDYTTFKQSRQGCEALLKQVDETYKTVVLNPILMGKPSISSHNCVSICSKRADSTTYRSYRGVAFEERAKYNGMYSFFPCQAYTENSLGFARPSIRMDRFISDGLTQNIKNTECNSLDEIRSYWEEVVEQVTGKCLLGISANMPPEE